MLHSQQYPPLSTNLKIVEFLLLLLIAILHISCREKLYIPQFDSNIWKNDKAGCQQKRLAQIAPLKQHKDKLLTASQSQILELLGKPDKIDLGDRTQKFYLYHYANSPNCKGQKQAKTKILKLRFSAVDRLTEVIFKED